jgi:ubiquinone/menaquinone biosynthesis C-methylase UbiE
LADVGCGNGKYLGCNPNIFTVGTDRSVNLLACAREANNDFTVFGADSLKLPVRSDSFDACISIAVIHHFSNDDMRI